MIDLPYLTTSQFARAIGVTSATVSAWDRTGTFVAHHRTPTGRKYYTQEQVAQILNNKCIPIPVMPPKQKPYIQRQPACNDVNAQVQAFCDEILPLCQWDLHPYKFLYDLYLGWAKKQNVESRLGRNTFCRALYNMIDNGLYPDWYCPPSIRNNIRPKHLMNTHEPLIIDYNLIRWMDHTYTGSDPKRITNFQRQDFYTGILRVIPKSI